MALRDQSTAATQATTVEAEAPEHDQAFVEQAVTQAEVAAAPAVVQSTGAVVAANSPLSNVSILRQMENIFNKMGKEWSFTVFTGINVSNGAVKTQNTKLSFGSYVDIRVLNWEDQYMVHCGVQTPTPETKELLRFSKDGVTLNDGTPVASWIQQLKEEGYPNAKCDQRAVILGVIQGSEKKVEGVNYVCASLSISSRNNWKAFVEQRDMDIQFMGKQDDPNRQTVRLLASSITNKRGEEYPAFEFKHQDDL